MGWWVVGGGVSSDGAAVCLFGIIWATEEIAVEQKPAFKDCDSCTIVAE